LARKVSKCVCRKAIGSVGVGSGHLIFELNRGEDFTIPENKWVSDGEVPERRYHKVFIVPG
jgi:hypothetical protein